MTACRTGRLDEDEQWFVYSVLDATRYLWTFEPVNLGFLMTLQNEAHELIERIVSRAGTKHPPSHSS